MLGVRRKLRLPRLLLQQSPCRIEEDEQAIATV